MHRRFLPVQFRDAERLELFRPAQIGEFLHRVYGYRHGLDEGRQFLHDLNGAS